MKYLIASKGINLNSRVAKRFGHADYFLIFDTAFQKLSVYPGIDYDEPLHGLTRFKGHGINRVILGNVGPQAFTDIEALGWKAFLCRNMSVEEAINKVENGDVAALTEPTMKKSIDAGIHNH